tara:strand:+ start:552 stop:1046 length:495 start_codon:yes stop_codon:yes gene_type:complete
MIVLKTNLGDIKIELDFDNTPVTAKNFQDYVESGFYNGTIFHRVIDGFMVQGGGFEPGMTEKENGAPIDNEAQNAKPNKRGTIAMARTNDPHSATSQFFINVKDNDFLNFTAANSQGFGYCAFGEVIEGMDVVDNIKKQATTSRAGHNDVPEQDVVIKEAVVEA